MIANRRRVGRPIGERLQLKPDPGERLQHSVVQIAREPDAIFADRELLQAMMNVEVLERVADFARDHLGERDEIGTGRGDADEEHPAGDVLQLERCRGITRLTARSLALERGAAQRGGIPGRLSRREMRRRVRARCRENAATCTSTARLRSPMTQSHAGSRRPSPRARAVDATRRRDRRRRRSASRSPCEAWSAGHAVHRARRCASCARRRAALTADVATATAAKAARRIESSAPIWNE